MRTLFICAAGALALAACQREEPADPVAATPAAADAGMDVAATPTETAGAPDAAAGGERAAAVPADGSSDTMGGQPPAEGMMSGPSPAVRDAAKEKAEETNLHPRTP
jgi:hypothetical protein